MFRHVRSAHRPHRQRLLALEPLEDRLLLSGLVGPLPAGGSGLNQTLPASVTQHNGSAAAPGANGSAGKGYAQAASTHTGSASSQDGYTPSQQNPANSYASDPASQQGAYYSEDGSSGGDSPAEYTSQASATTTPEAANSATPATTAVLGMAAAATVAPAPQPVAAMVQGPAFLPTPPAPAAAPMKFVAQAGPAEVPHAPAPAEVAWEAFRSGGPETAFTPASDESSVAVSPALETGPLFPLALPLPGGPLPVEVAAWEGAVRDLFSRLEALGDDVGEAADWGRLAPWCATLGAITVALEVVRRRLSKRYQPAPAEAAGRGLAWKWLPEPEGGEPPEQP
jgi:hypothetical protein